MVNPIVTKTVRLIFIILFITALGAGIFRKEYLDIIANATMLVIYPLRHNGPFKTDAPYRGK